LKEKDVERTKQKETEKMSKKLGGLVIFLFIVGIGGTFLMTGDIKATIWAFLAVSMLAMIIVSVIDSD